MYILTMPEGLQQQLILRNAGQNAQLHLRIITAHQVIIASSRPKNTANLLAFFGSRGDVLQIGIRAGKASRHGHSLLEMSVNTPRFGIHKRLQAFQISGLQLSELTMFQNRIN